MYDVGVITHFSLCEPIGRVFCWHFEDFEHEYKMLFWALRGRENDTTADDARQQ